MLADGVCNKALNCSTYDFDGGDCLRSPPGPRIVQLPSSSERVKDEHGLVDAKNYGRIYGYTWVLAKHYSESELDACNRVGLEPPPNAINFTWNSQHLLGIADVIGLRPKSLNSGEVPLFDVGITSPSLMCYNGLCATAAYGTTYKNAQSKDGKHVPVYVCSGLPVGVDLIRKDTACKNLERVIINTKLTVPECAAECARQDGCGYFQFEYEKTVGGKRVGLCKWEKICFETAPAFSTTVYKLTPGISSHSKLFKAFDTVDVGVRCLNDPTDERVLPAFTPKWCALQCSRMVGCRYFSIGYAADTYGQCYMEPERPACSSPTASSGYHVFQLHDSERALPETSTASNATDSSTHEQLGKSFVLLKSGFECDHADTDQLYFGRYQNAGNSGLNLKTEYERYLRKCAQRCRSQPGCSFFTFGQRGKSNEGDCYWEKRCLKYTPKEVDLYRLVADASDEKCSCRALLDGFDTSCGLLDSITCEEYLLQCFWDCSSEGRIKKLILGGVKCSHIVRKVTTAQQWTVGADLRDFTSQLSWIGCSNDGCQLDDFYCKNTSYSLEFGTKSSVLRSLYGTKWPKASRGCCNPDGTGLCNAPDQSSDAKALCFALGYVNGYVERVSSNDCPEPFWDGAGWSVDYARGPGYGKSYTCQQPLRVLPKVTTTKTAVTPTHAKPTRLIQEDALKDDKSIGSTEDSSLGTVTIAFCVLLIALLGFTCQINNKYKIRLLALEQQPDPNASPQGSPRLENIPRNVPPNQPNNNPHPNIELVEIPSNASQPDQLTSEIRSLINGPPNPNSQATKPIPAIHAQLQSTWDMTSSAQRLDGPIRLDEVVGKANEPEIWNCGQCDQINPSSNANCLICSEPRPLMPSTPQTNTTETVHNDTAQTLLTIASKQLMTLRAELQGVRQTVSSLNTQHQQAIEQKETLEVELNSTKEDLRYYAGTKLHELKPSEIDDLQIHLNQLQKNCIETRKTQLWKEAREKEANEMCSICLVSLRTHILLPCGHFVFCKECCDKVSSCPICMKRIKHRKHVFR